MSLGKQPGEIYLNEEQHKPQTPRPRLITKTAFRLTPVAVGNRELAFDSSRGNGGIAVGTLTATVSSPPRRCDQGRRFLA